MHKRSILQTSRHSTFYSSSSHTSRLRLILYRPPGCVEGRTCAAVWEDHDHVHLANPLLRKHSGILDPQPFIKRFPCASGMVDAFERAMEWLDSMCYAAQETSQIFHACESEPDWGLSCTGDVSNSTSGMDDLGYALPDAALTWEVAMQCLAQTIQSLLKEDPALLNGQMDFIEDYTNTRGVATVYLPGGLTIRVCLLLNIPRTDVIRCGILAKDRMDQPDARWQHTLLVIPGLDLEGPSFMTKNVTICSLEFDLIRAALLVLVSKGT